MSICDGCGGDYGHSPGCPVAEAYRQSQAAARRAEGPLKAEIGGLEREKGALKRKAETLRRALLDVLTSSSHEEAKRIAKNALARE